MDTSGVDTTSAVEQNPACPKLWVVIPCYNEEAVIPETSRRLTTKMHALLESGRIDPQSHVLLIDNGSRDATWSQIGQLHAGRLGELEVEPELFRGLSLAHNAGHQGGLYAGLMHALDHGCDCTISLDADLQDDIEAIDEMLAKHAAGAEVVYGVRNNRDTDTAFKRNTAEGFYGFMRWLGVEMVSDSADYRLMGRRSLTALSHYQEANLFLRGIVPSLGFPADKVYYRRAERFAGESKYPLGDLISFALEGITSFSTTPIRLVTIAGLLSLVFSLVMVIYALISRATGHVVPGWTSLMVSVWFVGGMVMVSLGIVGEYVGRTYIESKRRPRYIISDWLD